MLGLATQEGKVVLMRNNVFSGPSIRSEAQKSYLVHKPTIHHGHTTSIAILHLCRVREDFHVPVGLGHGIPQIGG